MKLYSGIDLHSNNHLVVARDQDDRIMYQRRLPNDLNLTLRELAPF